MHALLIALAVGLGLDGAEPPAKHKRPLAPPERVAVPAVKDRPLLSNPQLSFDGKRVFIARTIPASAAPARGLEVFAIALAPDAKAETVEFPVRLGGSGVKLCLSRNDKYLAVLSEGELWVKTLGDAAAPHRVYPPAEGEAPLGPRLSQASFGVEATWLLVESPTGWGHLVASTGELGALPLPPLDLTHGSMAMSSDGLHAIVTRSQQGEGYLNGSPVLALNISTAFLQGLDSEHLYTEVLFLPDGHPLGKESGGALWLLRPKSRFAYFTPPAIPRRASVDGYSINFAATKLAWTVTSDLEGSHPHAELWVAGAPPTPEPPKDSKKVGEE